MVDEVELWLDCLERKAGPRRFFKRFMTEVVDEHPRLRGKSPTELLEFQANAQTRRDRFLIPDALRQWIGRMKLTASTKKTRYGQINSFFLHRNKEGLPRDLSFHWKNSVEPVDGYLPVEQLRAIIANSNPMYRAVFLMKAQGLLDNAGLIYISDHHARSVLERISKNAGVFRLSLPSRKMNPKPFFTMLSSRSDFADAFREYLRATTNDVYKHLFWSQAGNPLRTHNIQYYFHRRAVEAGIVRRFTPDCKKCAGQTVWRRRMYLGEKMVCYVCLKCGTVQFACELGQEWRRRLSRVRYGKHPHETRDLMSSRWGMSGADRVVREGIMGHVLDPNDYEKFKYQEGYAEAEYRRFLPYANIMTEDPLKVDRRVVDEELDSLRREIAQIPVLMRKLEELEKHLE